MAHMNVTWCCQKIWKLNLTPTPSLSLLNWFLTSFALEFFISRFWNHRNYFGIASRTKSQNLKVLQWKPGWGCEGCLCVAHELSFYTALRDRHINQLKPHVPIWKGTQCCWKLLLQLNKWDLFCAEIQAKNIWGATSCPGCKKNAHLYFIEAKIIPSYGHKILLEMWFSGEFGSVGLKVGLDGLRGLLNHNDSMILKV